MAVYQKFKGTYCIYEIVIGPPKGTSVPGTTSYDEFCVKSVQRCIPLLKNPPKRKKTSYIKCTTKSSIWRAEPLITTKLCMRGCSPWRNHACQFWWRSVKGFRRGDASKFGLYHGLVSSPLQHSRTTVRVCDAHFSGFELKRIFASCLCVLHFKTSTVAKIVQFFQHLHQCTLCTRKHFHPNIHASDMVFLCY